MNYPEQLKSSHSRSKAMPTDKAFGPSGAPAPVMTPKTTVGVEKGVPAPVTRSHKSKVGLG